MIRVMLADDHPVFREGVRAMLAAVEDVSVVGEASTTKETYGLLETTEPDVVLLDLVLPEAGGIAAMREIQRRRPEAGVLVLTVRSEVEYAVEALQAGARGFAVKEQSGMEIVDAIRTVARGERYVAPQLPSAAVESGLRRQQNGDRSDDPLHPLSRREREVFNLAVRGMSNVGIAGELSISVKTVETHRARINRKLSVHGTADLIRFAANHGMALS